MRARAASSPTRPWCFRSAMMSSWTDCMISLSHERRLSCVSMPKPEICCVMHCDTIQARSDWTFPLPAQVMVSATHATTALCSKG
eukprot:4884794-Prymnesium_polylepis.1